MQTSNIHDEVRAILARIKRSTPLPAQLTDDMSLADDLNIDSARLVDVVLDLEERYSIRIEDERMERLRTFGDLVGVVAEATSLAA